MSFINITRSEKDSSKIVNLSEAGVTKAKELKKTLTKIENLLFVYFAAIDDLRLIMKY